MKQLTFFLAMHFIVIPVFSQSNISSHNGKKWEQLEGSGKIIRFDPTIGAFSSIEINNANVKFKIVSGAPEYGLNISIDDNLKDFLKWQVKNDSLRLYFDLSGGKYPRWLSDNNTVITIKAPRLENLINKGNSEIEIELKNQDSFNLVTDGNPDIKIAGKTETLYLQSKGNADIMAGELVAEKILLSSNGNADIEVRTKELIEKDVKGNNDIVNLYYTSTNKKQVEENYSQESQTGLINFQLKNNSLLPKKITIISYRPDVIGNGTNSFFLLAMATRKLKFPSGTKIYIATSEQVNTVMSGAGISDQEPFLTVKKEDAGKIFKIN